jgi:hypothetical protein
MLFADSEPFVGISLNLKPGYAPLHVIKLFYTKTICGSGIVYTATLRHWLFPVSYTWIKSRPLENLYRDRACMQLNLCLDLQKARHTCLANGINHG